jgi:ABC-type transport system involved in multi-copper enzyme maturation permease subunit
MTTATFPPQSTPQRTVPRATTIGFGNLLKSEWTKLRTVRSTFWTTAIAVLATGILAVVVCVQSAHDVKTGHQSIGDLDAVMTALTGFFLVQVTAGALGVMTISSEYGTGMIRATLGAVPQRRAMLAAKGLVFAACTFVISEILSFAAVLVGQAILHSQHAGVSLWDGQALRATFGGGLYITAIGLLGFGLGALIRNTAAALSAFFGIVFASTPIVDLLPTSWRDHVIQYMPINAGSQILSTQTDHQSLTPWHGFAVLCLYPLVAITAAAILIKRRDA